MNKRPLVPELLSLNHEGQQLDMEIKNRAHDKFQGFGRIWINGVALRGPRPMLPEIRSPFGMVVQKLRWVRHQCDPSHIRIELECLGAEGGPMDWMLHSVRNREVTGDWTAAGHPEPVGTLVFELKPVLREIGGQSACGFSYQWHYHSVTHRIHRITDRATWEPGGSILFRSFWMRNSFAPPIVEMRRDTSYSTEWYLPTSTNPDIFQFLPLQTHLQGFTFTTGRPGTLVTWATQPGHIRSLFEKRKGDTCLAHWHQHCGDLTPEFSTLPMEVLWFPGRRDKHALAALYDAMRELVYNQLHDEIGMRREKVGPYAILEEWSDADMDRYREEILPKLIAAGARTIGLANHFQNNMNTYGVSNMCCNVDFRVAEDIGIDRLAAFTARARQDGCAVEMWGNTAISLLPLQLAKTNGRKKIDVPLPDGPDSILNTVRRAARPWVLNQTGGMEADHYHSSFAVLNLRDPHIRDYWLRCWRRLKETTGIDGIFLDSSFNLSGDHFHYQRNPHPGGGGATMDRVELLGTTRPEGEREGMIESQYLAHLSLMVAMQQDGFHYNSEDSGVFGMHRNGPSCVTRARCMFMWNEFLGTFDPRALLAAGFDPDKVFFEGLAWRNMWMLYWDWCNQAVSFTPDGGADPLCRPNDRHARLFALFNRCNQPDFRREVLADGNGIAYHRDGEIILWSLRPHRFKTGSTRLVHCSGAEKPEAVEHGPLLHTTAHEVYHLLPVTGTPEPVVA
jgi:hypothetical protein